MTPARSALTTPETADQVLPDWPTFGLEDDMRPALARAMAGGEPAVLATLYAATGGTPRGLGAQMLVTRDGCSGFLSGGCVEGDVALRAMQTLADGRPQWLTYGEGGPFDIRLPCGSRIEILLERIAPNDLSARRLVGQPASRRPMIWITNGMERACMDPGGVGRLPPALQAARRPWEAGKSCGHTPAPFVAWRTYEPRIRLVVVGSDPAALALLRLGSQAGFETIMVRPHGPQTAPQGADRYVRTDIAQAFADLELDAWTAVASLTHDLEEEHAVLRASLPGPGFYVGALGSDRRIPARNARLKAAEIPDDQIAVVHAPIGLPIGGKSAWAIAVSIMAEIMAQAHRAKLADYSKPTNTAASSTDLRRETTALAGKLGSG